MPTVCDSLWKRGMRVILWSALIPADLQMEYIVRLTKGHLRSMCSNKTDESLIKRSSAFYGMDEISHINLDKENCVVHHALKHRRPSSYEDEMKIIQDLRSVKPFSSNLRRVIPLKRTLTPPIKKLNKDHILNWISFNKLIYYHEF